jgi:hypothetical protein
VVQPEGARILPKKDAAKDLEAQRKKDKRKRRKARPKSPKPTKKDLKRARADNRALEPARASKAER